MGSAAFIASRLYKAKNNMAARTKNAAAPRNRDRGDSNPAPGAGSFASYSPAFFFTLGIALSVRRIHHPQNAATERKV
jgi:hypothetical protein